MVRSGKDKGKKAKVLRVFAAANKILVEGVGEVNRRRRPKKSGEKGQTVVMATPINISNAGLFCGTCGKAVRIGSKLEGSKRIRVCVKCKGTI